MRACRVCGIPMVRSTHGEKLREVFTTTTRVHCGSICTRGRCTSASWIGWQKLVHCNILGNDFAYLPQRWSPNRHDMTVVCECTFQTGTGWPMPARGEDPLRARPRLYFFSQAHPRREEQERPPRFGEAGPPCCGPTSFRRPTSIRPSAADPRLLPPAHELRLAALPR